MGLKESLPIWNSLMKALIVNIDHLCKSWNWVLRTPPLANGKAPDPISTDG